MSVNSYSVPWNRFLISGKGVYNLEIEYSLGCFFILYNFHHFRIIYWFLVWLCFTSVNKLIFDKIKLTFMEKNYEL